MFFKCIDIQFLPDSLVTVWVKIPLLKNYIPMVSRNYYVANTCSIVWVCRRQKNCFWLKQMAYCSSIFVLLYFRPPRIYRPLHKSPSPTGPTKKKRYPQRTNKYQPSKSDELFSQRIYYCFSQQQQKIFKWPKFT